MKSCTHVIKIEWGEVKFNQVFYLLTGLGERMHKKIKKFRALNQEIRSCKKCKLWRTRTHALPGEGNVSSKLVMIAQAPGYTEDRREKMFIGPSGKKLDELLEEADIAREDIFMTNLLRCMLPHYRRPHPDEIEACTLYLNREIDLVNPTVIATLGYFPAKYIFEKFGIGDKLEFPEVCGKVFSAEGKKIIPLGHPAALLYNNSIEEKMKENYRKLKRLLDST